MSSPRSHHKHHVRKDKSNKLADGCMRQNCVEKTLRSPECTNDGEECRLGQQNAKASIVVTRTMAEANEKFSNEDIGSAQLVVGNC